MTAQTPPTSFMDVQEYEIRRDTMLEFGQWLANSPARIYDLQDTIDSGDGEAYAAFVDMYLGKRHDESAARLTEGSDHRDPR